MTFLPSHRSYFSPVNCRRCCCRIIDVTIATSPLTTVTRHHFFRICSTTTASFLPCLRLCPDPPNPVDLPRRCRSQIHRYAAPLKPPSSLTSASLRLALGLTAETTTAYLFSLGERTTVVTANSRSYLDLRSSRTAAVLRLATARPLLSPSSSISHTYTQQHSNTIRISSSSSASSHSSSGLPPTATCTATHLGSLSLSPICTHKHHTNTTTTMDAARVSSPRRSPMDLRRTRHMHRRLDLNLSPPFMPHLSLSHSLAKEEQQQQLPTR